MKKFTLDKIVLISAWIFQAVQYTRVFLLLDSGILGWVSGITGGVMAASGITYIASRAPKVKAKRARMATWAALGLILLITPVLVTYANLASLTGITEGVARHVYSIAAAVVADAFIAGVAFAGGSLVRVEEPLSDDTSEPKAKPAPKAAKAFRCECGFTTLNGAAYSGHCRSCGVHRDTKDPKPVPADSVFVGKK